MIWIIGGTIEARIFTEKIKDIKDFLVTSATESEREFINEDRLLVGRMDYPAMEKFVKEKRIKILVDLSHPYAIEVSKNARKVAEKYNIKYLRYTRAMTDRELETIYLNDYEECLELLKSIKGNCFFTTGSKNIGDFEKIKGKNRFIYRILPALESLEECKRYNIKMRDIVAVLGPFSLDYNKAMFSEYSADYVVMKDSGEEGGTREKILACQELNIVPIVIGREAEKGINDLTILEEMVRGINNSY